MTEFLLARDYPSARILRQTTVYEFTRIVGLRKGWPRLEGGMSQRNKLNQSVY